ncbi:hypothetical protein PP459_gp048 [Streptomyces phage Wakanda]|uniref:Serine/threonine kinase n=1 Tax=Streptomyces phage Wakanda TaxID=2713267 RepID=A0A6G8R1U8_9CAUD|nr:hypothetical protein PP459_gp048 [Streptomyces phage Wakanda]QIN94185.1 hypothetical protein SEA_WAKANDA_225 [Streptomyces phage Wakanda]
MIGSLEEAAEIAQWDIEYDEYCEITPPEGWEYLGDGAYRFAFRSPSGVVYKIENEDGRYYGHNHREYVNIQRCKKSPVKGWRVPEASFFEVPGQGQLVDVIAMEYVSGGDDTHCNKSFSFGQQMCTCGKPGGRCTAQVWEEVRSAWGIQDVHSGNIRIDDDGTRVLIDCADDD